MVLRRHQHDVSRLLEGMRDFNQWQSEFFVTVNRFLIDYEAPAFQPIHDEDVAQAAAALSATLETASRGVIYDHQPESLPAARLLAALRPLVDEFRRQGPPTFEHDAAVVLRRIVELVGGSGTEDATDPRRYLALLRRLLVKQKEEPPADSGLLGPSSAGTPRLIVP